MVLSQLESSLPVHIDKVRYVRSHFIIRSHWTTTGASKPLEVSYMHPTDFMLRNVCTSVMTMYTDHVLHAAELLHSHVSESHHTRGLHGHFRDQTSHTIFY